jgi:hypothetical protein
MPRRGFHPKAIVYSLYLVLFISNAYTAAVMLPLLSVFFGGIVWINLSVIFVPFLVGFVLSELLESTKLLRSAALGTLIIGFTSLLGAISNRVMIKQLRDFVESFPQITDAVIMGNLEAAGMNTAAVLILGVLAFNAPILYRYLQDREN